MTIREMRDQLWQQLRVSVGDAEAKAMANIILEDVKGYTPTQLVIHGERQLLDDTVELLRRIAQRIIEGEPMQYVIGTARFRGRDFDVNPSVLIPRPETGQLVDLIIDENDGRKDVRVLDIGCGSGCIAISLALDLAFSEVDAIDISPKSVDTTISNAKKLMAKVNAYVIDIFTTEATEIADKRYDIIVSNPPYILQSEASSMDSRVKDHEPHCALFVADDQPISIYTAIADYAKGHLNPGGKLYLEINPLCYVAIKDMLKTKGYSDIEILPDYRGNKRFAKASL